MMIKKERLTKLLDELRHSKQIKVSDFTHDVISERNYRRYINEEQSLPFNVLVELVNKLNMQMGDFLIYALNKTAVDFQQEIYLEHYIQTGQLEEADKLFEEMDHESYQTHIGSLYLPILIQKYFYLKKQLPKDAYVSYALDRIDLTTLSKQQVIDRQHLEVLILLLEDSDAHTQSIIIPIIYDVITQKKALISFKTNVDINHAIQVLIKALFSNESLKSLYQDLLPSLLELSLSHTVNSHLEPGYKEFLTHSITFFKEANDMPSYRRYVYYFMSFIISNGYFETYLKEPFTQMILDDPNIQDIIDEGIQHGYSLVNEVKS